MEIIQNILKDVAGSLPVQSVITTGVGITIKVLAAFLQKNVAPDERGKAILSVAVTFLSLVMGFLNQWIDGTLNAFDPAPWVNFFVVLAATFGMLTAADKGAEKAKAMLRSFKGN